MGNITLKLAICRDLMLRFDKAQEDCLLTPLESWFHKSLKVTFLGLASLECTFARQYRLPQGRGREHNLLTPSMLLSTAKEQDLQPRDA